MDKKTIKILAIDDNPDNLVVLKALIHESFPAALFITADSGRKGIELCNTEKPDVILLDIVMPGMDGYEVCARIKSDPRLRHTPVVMVTANRADKESHINALEAGADAFLLKPVDEYELKAEIRAMLRIKESEDLKKEEKERLENMVLDRTEALENELSDRKKTEEKLLVSLDKLTRNRQAILNLMEDLKSEMAERKLVEENLQSERNLLRTLIDNLPDTVYVMDKEGKVIVSNKTDLKYIGSEKEEEVLGKTDVELFPGRAGIRFHADNLSVINTGTPLIEHEELFINKEGNKQWLLTSKYPLFDQAGKAKGLLGTGHDITFMKIAAEELEAKNRELSFLNAVALELSQLATSDNINEYLSKKLKEFSGALLAVSMDYDPEKKILQIRHIETNKAILNKISKAIGTKYLKTEIPLDSENLKFILEENFAISNSLAEISFGKVPELVNKTIKAISGIDRFYAVANITGDEYFGSIMLGFKSGVVGPGKELILSFARMASTAIQRRRSEEKLRKSEEQYRMLIENQGEGVGIVDLDENFVFSNPAADEMFGVEKVGLLNRNLFDFIVQGQKSIVKLETKKREKAIKSTYEIDIVRSNDEIRTILVTATPQFDINGKLSGTFGVFRDITERKHAELEIRQKQKFIEGILENSPIGFAVNKIDDGKIEYVGSKFEEIYGVDHGSLNSVEDFFEKVYIDPVQREIMRHRTLSDLRSKDPARMKWDDIEITTKTGEQRVITAINIPLYEQNLMISTVQDVTSRKKAESDLIKSKEKAEESDRLKTAFLHNISHEIRTPMNAIIGFSSLLNEPDLDADSQNSYTEIITQSSNQLLDIVNDIIEISNIEAGILKLHSKKSDLNTVLKNIYKQYKPKALEKGIGLKLETGLTDNKCTVNADETKLIQVISNLLNNAFKFTTTGHINFGYSHKSDNLEFFVSDTGIGIPEEQHARIFERFYQVENLKTRIYEGTGLGLAISKAYVELLGGEIWLTSQPEQGTTFFFTIPYLPEEKDSVKEVHFAEKANFDNYCRKTILIAEDEEDNFRLMKTVLSSLNLNIIHAVNGKEAVDICESDSKIDLVVMDIKMPVMNGYEATEKIKKMRPAVPVIAQTAFALGPDRENALRAGCDDYISKPYKKEFLISMIKKYL